MKIKLKLRALTAYFSPCKVVLADNEDLIISIIDKGQLGNRVVLCVNNKTFVAEEKIVTIPRSDLENVNVIELTEREESNDAVLKKFTVENLYVLSSAVGNDGTRLIAERKFYSETFEAVCKEINTLREVQMQLEKKVADLENGKFTILKFLGGKNK